MPPKLIESMQYRENRLETFENGSLQHKSKQKRYWTHSTPDIGQLVDCGFYFTPTKINNDQITCISCRKKETNVGGVKNIADYHLTNNPNCPLALIISSQINHLSNDAADFWTSQPSNLFNDPISKESIELRKKTFGNNWKYDKNKKKSKTTSNSLAKAGFYYCPLRYGNDRVQCVYCNCSLDTWLAEDDPIEEHKNNANGYCYFLEKFEEPRSRSRSRSTSRSRSNSQSLIESENDTTNGDQNDSRLNVGKAVKVKADSDINDDVLPDTEDSEYHNIKRNIPNDSPKKINKKSVISESLYESRSHERSAISEDDSQDVNESYQLQNTNTDVVNEGRMNRLKRRKLNSTISSNANESLSSSQDYIEKVEQSKVDSKVGDDIIDGRNNRNLDDGKDEKEISISSDEKHQHKEDFTNQTKSETKTGSDIEEGFQGETSISRRNNKTRKDKKKAIEETSQKKVEYIDDEVNLDIDDPKQDEMSPDLSEFDDNSYSVSESDSNSRTSNNATKNTSKTGNYDDYWDRVPGDDLVNEFISTRTRRGKKNLRNVKGKDKNEETKGNTDDVGEDISKIAIEESGDNPDESDYKSEESEASMKIKRSVKHDSVTSHTKGENQNKRTRKDAIDNLSFDDERFEQVLKSPKKVKKLKINDKRKTPSPPIYDLSNQNLGDYQEDNLPFLENDIGPILKPSQSHTTKSNAPVNKIDKGVTFVNHNKKLSRNEAHHNTKTKPKTNKSSNILDISFEDSTDDIFVKNDKPFTFDVKNPLSMTNSKRPESIETKRKKEESSPKNLGNEIPLTEDVFNINVNQESPVRDTLPSDVSVSSDIQADGAVSQSRETAIPSMDSLMRDNEKSNADTGNLEVQQDSEVENDSGVEKDLNDSKIKNDWEVKDDREVKNDSEIKNGLEIQNNPDVNSHLEIGNDSITENDSNAKNHSNVRNDSDAKGNSDAKNESDAVSDLNDSDTKGNLDANNESDTARDSDAASDSDATRDSDAANNLSGTNTPDLKKYSEGKNNLDELVDVNEDDSVLLSYSKTDIEENPRTDNTIRESATNVNKTDLSRKEDNLEVDGQESKTINNAVASENSTKSDVDLEVKSPSTKSHIVESANHNSNTSSYAEYIQVMKEIDDGLQKTSGGPTSPEKATSKPEAESKNVSGSSSETRHDSPSMAQTGGRTLQLTTEQNESTSTDKAENPEVNGSPDNSRPEAHGPPEAGTQNDVSNAPPPDNLRSAIDKFSGNFSNLLESSTPEKKDKQHVSTDKGPDTKPTSTSTESRVTWSPKSHANLLENLGNMEAASEYLNKSLNSKYDLHDDYDGELTNFISNMPEEEENMTIQEWIKHNAANCRKLAKQTCDDMIEAYKEEHIRAIKTLEQLPTVD